MSDVIRTITFYVEDMRCGGCAASIETVLKKITGVKSVSTVLETKQVMIDIEPALSSEILIQAVQAAGFSVQLLS